MYSIPCVGVQYGIPCENLGGVCPTPAPPTAGAGVLVIPTDYDYMSLVIANGLRAICNSYRLAMCLY